MPLGNGRVGVNVWADSNNTLWLLLSHVDALDENTILSKLGRIRLRALFGDNDGNTVDAGSEERPAASSTASGMPGQRRGKKSVAFRQAMNLDNATVHIDLPTGVSLDVWVDANADVVRVASESTGPEPHRLEATLETWRTSTAPYPWAPPSYWCPTLHPNVTQHADIVEPRNSNGSGSVLFYHRNLPEWTQPSFRVDLDNQDIRDANLVSRLVNITFGGIVTGARGSDMVLAPPPRLGDHLAGSLRNATSHRLVSALASQSQGVAIACAAGVYDDGVGRFVDDLNAAAVAPSDRASHNEFWSAFWNASVLDVTAAPATVSPAAAHLRRSDHGSSDLGDSYGGKGEGGAASRHRSRNSSGNSQGEVSTVAAGAKRISLLDRVNRAAFHSMAGGRLSAIKFNGYGIFAAYPGPQEDYRPWGPDQWFQNIRLPYYHMLADGRFEDMISLFTFYGSILNVSRARTRSWFGINGTFFPETAQQSGLYDSGQLGWNCQSASTSVPIPQNPYIRYHREGGLELALLMLDWLAHTNNATYFRDALMPQIALYVQYYAEHFADDPDTGRLDMFPAQALETWQCKSVPPTRDNCVTNPTPEVAGLHAVLPRLLSLDDEALPADTGERARLRAAWVSLARRVPDLAVGKCMQGNTSATCVLPGARLPPSVSNSENADLYAVHPFRVIGVRANRSLGVATYENRRFRGSTGWSEDLMDAALLGLADEAAAAAVARANVAPYTGYRWVGFQGGIGAGGPITDHGGVATAGLRYMLLHPATLAHGANLDKQAIVLFPAWPCTDWAVRFRLHAPGGTTVAGYYDGAGKLFNFTVSPQSRKKDVVFASCVKGGPHSLGVGFRP